MNALVSLEPIKLPDPRRPGTIPSLPAWLERCSGAVKLELQPTADGASFEKEEVPTLPAELMPTKDQRQAMEEHIASLRSYLAETPAESVDAESKMAAAITALLLVLPTSRKSDLGQEARADVYLDVLDDVPWWAVKAAIKSWHRHDCGNDELGKPYDYRWAPDPGTLRRCAYGETWDVKQRIRKLEKVLSARVYIDCSAQLEAGKAAMAGLGMALKDGTATGLSFAAAIARSQQPAGEESAA